MTRMLRLVIILSVLILPIKAPGAELIFATGEWPPFTIVKEGKLTGINIDIIREFIKRNNLDARIEVMPWKRALNGVRTGKYHALFTTKKIPEREQFLHYPQEYLQSQPTAIFTIKGENITAESLEDLRDKTIGIVRGYTYSKEFDSSKTIVKDESLNDNMMLKKLSSRRYDLIVGEEIPLKHLAHQHDIILETVYTLSNDAFYIGFSKKGLGAEKEKLASLFDQTMRELAHEGFVSQVTTAYMSPSEN